MRENANGAWDTWALTEASSGLLHSSCTQGYVMNSASSIYAQSANVPLHISPCAGTPSFTPTRSMTATDTATRTSTVTSTDTPTFSQTVTGTDSSTVTPTRAFSATATATPTFTGTDTASATVPHAERHRLHHGGALAFRHAHAHRQAPAPPPRRPFSVTASDDRKPDLDAQRDG